jgi:CRP-like cAMP-binding protein/Fe-S-cluster-containing hydrogenase component 2
MNKIRSRSFIRREEQFQDRWTSFGKHTGIRKIYSRLPAAKLKKFDIFNGYDLQFLEKISPDICVTVWDKQRVLFEEGSYIDLAFFVVKGQVEVCVQKQQNLLSKPIFDKERSKIYSADSSNGKGKIQRLSPTVLQTQITQIKKTRKVTYLSSMDVDLNWGGTLSLGPGEMFGETGASVGWPQSVTAKTTTQCILIQIRVPALEAMKRKSVALKQRLNKIYVERSLSAQLKNTPLFQGCSDQFIEEFKRNVELQSFRRNDLITQEGAAADAVYLVRSGFVKLSQRFGAGELVVNYLSKGMVLGEIEFLLKHADWIYSATSVENTELVRISHADFEKVMARQPQVQRALWESSARRIKESGFSKRNIAESEFLSTALETGLVEGNSVLVIDLDICTRCDDCVRGCADTHDGLPKFVREGEKYQNFLIARSCYQCQDPVCLIGCPTGAIRRAGVGDVVEIDAELCIGCQACYQKCPYNAITMVKTEELLGQHAAVKKARNEITQIATKCDLCFNTGHTPACVSNCPHGCAIRVPGMDKFSKLLSRREGGKINSRFRLFKFAQSPGWATAFVAATIACLLAYLTNLIVAEVNPGNVWGLSYGSAAAALMLGAAFYGVRRRKMKSASRQKWGKAQSWVQFHIYGGAIFMLLVLMHSGFRLPNGALFWWLWILSVWVTISGMVGVVLQKWLPRILASALSIEVVYERIPELIQAIRKNADNLATNCSLPVKDFYRKKIATSLTAPTSRLIYFVDITGGIQRRLRQFDFLKTLLPSIEREKLLELELIYKSKLEIDAHYTLQKALKVWLYLHLPASVVLLVLVAIHLFAAFYY